MKTSASILLLTAMCLAALADDPPPAIPSPSDPPAATEATTPTPPAAPRFGPGVTAVDPAAELRLKGFSTTRYSVSLLVMAGLLGGGFLLLRKFRGRLPMAAGSGGRLRLVQRLNLDSRNAVAIVEVEGERLLLGMGQDGVRLLRRCPEDLDELDEFEDPLDTPAAPAVAPPSLIESFASCFRRPRSEPLAPERER